MKQIDSINIDELKSMASNMYDELVKAVVDVEKRLVVVDAGLHVDEEQFLLKQGSLQSDLWGINLYPDYYGQDDFIEFDSMINIRPAQNNRSRSVDNPDTQTLIREIVAEVVHG
ncbi:MAG: DUF5674 family protein [Coriobacteriales bacterium]|jgi:hypothetical protein|nr:DUF5674 family protein [Coriobacteriales bacterium]